MPGLSLQGLEDSARRRHADVAVEWRRRNRKGDGEDTDLSWSGGGVILLTDVETMEVQRVMDILEILHHEPT